MRNRAGSVNRPQAVGSSRRAYHDRSEKLPHGRSGCAPSRPARGGRVARPALALLAVIALAVVGCAGEPSDAELDQVGEPDLRLDVQRDRHRTGPLAGVHRADEHRDRRCSGAGFRPGGSGGGRGAQPGPTTRARIVDIDGREISGLAPSAKQLEWVPERVKAGVTLEWEVALRCLGEADGGFAVEVRPTTVGSVQEAEFDPIRKDLSMACGGARDAAP